MPYDKQKNHPECPASKPWAVVKKTDGEVMGCHASEADADKQIAALHANEADLVSEFLFVALGDGEARPVEFLTTGVFIDSKGRPVEVTSEDLDAYVANFAAGAAGQDVPIDVDHERKEAAGWVAAIERVGDKLRFIPDWTKLGLELVGERIYRYVSATLDTVNKVVKTISLVNLPAVKGLAPAELAEGIYTMKRMTIAQRLTQGIERLIDQVLGGKDAELADGVPGTARISEYLQARIHKQFTVVADDWAASGLLTVDERKALSGAIGSALEAFAAAVGDVGERLIQVPGPDLYYYTEHNQAPDMGAPPEEEVDMGDKTKLSDLSEEEVAALRAEIRQEEQAKLKERDTLKAELREEMLPELRAELEAENKRHSEFVQFAEQLCNGDHGLAEKPEDVVEFLESLPDDAVERAKKVLSAKVVNFGEAGSSRDGRGGQMVLAQPYVDLLKRWIADGNELDEFFTVNADELGEMGQYDLAEFKQE